MTGHPQAILAEAMREGRLPEERQKHYSERLSHALILDTAVALELFAPKEPEADQYAPEDAALDNAEEQKDV